jgi:copper chaperone
MKRAITIAFGFVLLATLGVVVLAAPQTVTLRVEGMTYGGCATDIEKALRATDGVLEARVSFEKGEAWVRYDDRKLTVEKIRKAIDEAGYTVVDGSGKSAGAVVTCCAGKSHGGPGCTMVETADSASESFAYSTDLAELRARFNGDKGKVRIVMLLSPTCPMCVGGASVIQTKVLDKVKSPDVRAYAVWVPILDSDAETTVGKATTRLPDARVSRYWDAQSELVKSYARVLGLGERPAWDVYMLYGPEVEWKADPPTPDAWMHQLRGLDANRRLDGDKLAAELHALVERARGKAK